MAAIDGDLLERLNQFSGALQIRDELVCSVATIVSELGEQGTAHRTRGDLVGEVRAAVRERRGHRKTDADWVIDLVSNPRDETAECGESLGFDEIALRFAGVQSCFGQPPLVPDFGKQRSKNQCADRHK